MTFLRVEESFSVLHNHFGWKLFPCLCRIGIYKVACECKNVNKWSVSLNFSAHPVSSSFTLFYRTETDFDKYNELSDGLTQHVMRRSSSAAFTSPSPSALFNSGHQNDFIACLPTEICLRGPHTSTLENSRQNGKGFQLLCTMTKPTGFLLSRDKSRK